MDKVALKELVEMREQMKDLLQNVKDHLRQNAPRSTYEQAKAYWIGHIDVALGGGDFVDTFDMTFEKTLKGLGWNGEDSDDLSDDEEEEEEEGEDEEVTT